MTVRDDYTTDEMMTVGLARAERRRGVLRGHRPAERGQPGARDARAQLLPDLRVRHPWRQAGHPAPQHR